jgi:hypothetical protein
VFIFSISIVTLSQNLSSAWGLMVRRIFQSGSGICCVMDYRIIGNYVDPQLGRLHAQYTTHFLLPPCAKPELTLFVTPLHSANKADTFGQKADYSSDKSHIPPTAHPYPASG